MKTLAKNIAVLIIALVASINFANAQSVKAYQKADSTMQSKYSKNAYMVVRHGNNSAKAEISGVYDFMDKSFGANAKLYWFHYGWMYGIDGSYLQDRSSVNAFAGYRFTGPKSPVFVEASAGAGMTQQWNITGNAGDISGDVNGEYVMLLASSKMNFSAFGEVKFGARLGKRVELFAAGRILGLFSEGKYSDAANKIILNNNNGKPLQIVQKTAEGHKALLVENLKKAHGQLLVGFTVWF